jgi:hypothetical protein
VVDYNEEIAGPGVVKITVPERVDCLFVAKGRIVGVESKTVQDAVSSWLERRLQRQLRTLLHMVDIPVLMLRTRNSWAEMSEFPRMMLDLFKFQLIGGMEESGHDGCCRGPGLILFAPEKNPYEMLSEAKATLEGRRNLLTVLAGSDSAKRTGTVREVAIQKAIPYVGPKIAKAMAGKGNLIWALTATDEELKKCGANRRVLEARKLILG